MSYKYFFIVLEYLTLSLHFGGKFYVKLYRKKGGKTETLIKFLKFTQTETFSKFCKNYKCRWFIFEKESDERRFPLFGGIFSY